MVVSVTSNLISLYNGFDMDDISITGNSTNGLLTLVNKTPRKFASLNFVYNDEPIQLAFNRPIGEFSTIIFFINNFKKYNLNDKIDFIDPNPLFRVGASSFSSGSRTVSPPNVIVGLNEAEIRMYHRIEINLKITYNQAKTKSKFLSFITDPNLCSPQVCSESDHSMSDALSKWMRITAHTLNAQVVAFDNSDAAGLAAGAWYGLHRCVINANLQVGNGCGYGKYFAYEGFSHENAHEQGYSHSSGLAYGWDPHITQLIIDNLATGLISYTNVTVESSDCFIGRKKGNVFYLACTSQGIYVTRVSVTFSDLNLLVTGIQLDSTNTYFEVGVTAGRSDIILSVTLSDGRAVYKIASVEGFWPIAKAPAKLAVFKPISVSYVNNNFYVMLPSSKIGSRVISYTSFLDGRYLMDDHTNGPCYYCYTDGQKVWTGVSSGSIKPTSVFAVTVTLEDQSSYTFEYAAVDVLSGMSNDILTPQFVKLRNRRIIVKMPVEVIGSNRFVSVRVLVDGKYVFQDVAELNGHVCYDCVYFGTALDFQHINIQTGIESSKSTVALPYVVSSNLLPASYATSVNNVTLIVREVVGDRQAVFNFTMKSLMVEEAVAPTASPTVSVPPSLTPSLMPSIPTAKPSLKPSSANPSLKPSPSPSRRPTQSPSGNHFRTYINDVHGMLVYLFHGMLVYLFDCPTVRLSDVSCYLTVCWL